MKNSNNIYRHLIQIFQVVFHQVHCKRCKSKHFQAIKIAQLRRSQIADELRRQHLNHASYFEIKGKPFNPDITFLHFFFHRLRRRLLRYNNSLFFGKCYCARKCIRLVLFSVFKYQSVNLSCFS